MNIAIPFRPAPGDSIELRYALRSIHKHLAGYDDIYIIGEGFPSWLTGVKTILAYEESIKTARNILKKILTYFDERPDYEVLQWQDDIYLTSPLGVNDIKYWYDGSLEQAIPRHHGGYRTMIENTALKTTDQQLYFDVHVPIIYQRDAFRRVATKYDWGVKSYLVKTLYCNMIMAVGEPMLDCKISGPCDLPGKVGDSLFFSTSPQGLSDDVVNFLDSLFPEPSPWEK